MDKIQIIEIEGVEHVIIERGNDQFTSMLKSTYEELQAQQVEHLTEIVPSEATAL